MKTSSKISIIAGAATLALVGTAFAAWEFNKSVEETINSNVAITKDASVGTITITPNTFYLTLDQDVLAFTSSDHTDSDATVSDQLTEVEFKYTGSAKSNDVSDVTLTVTYVADAALLTYVSFTDGSLGTPTVAANVKTATYTLPTVSWVAKPTTQADFNTMKTALNGAKITFTFTATVA